MKKCIYFLLACATTLAAGSTTQDTQEPKNVVIAPPGANYNLCIFNDWEAENIFLTLYSPHVPDKDVQTTIMIQLLYTLYGCNKQSIVICNRSLFESIKVLYKLLPAVEQQELHTFRTTYKQYLPFATKDIWNTFKNNFTKNNAAVYYLYKTFQQRITNFYHCYTIEENPYFLIFIPKELSGIPFIHNEKLQTYELAKDIVADQSTHRLHYTTKRIDNLQQIMPSVNSAFTKYSICQLINNLCIKNDDTRCNILLYGHGSPNSPKEFDQEFIDSITLTQKLIQGEKVSTPDGLGHYVAPSNEEYSTYIQENIDPQKLLPSEEKKDMKIENELKAWVEKIKKMSPEKLLELYQQRSILTSGLTTWQFEELLTTAQEYLTLQSFIYSSCYGGGSRLTELFYKPTTEYSFPIIYLGYEFSTTSVSLSASSFSQGWLSTYTVHFVLPLQELQKALQELIVGDIEYGAYLLKKMSRDPNNLALIKYPHTSTFTPLRNYGRIHKTIEGSAKTKEQKHLYITNQNIEAGKTTSAEKTQLYIETSYVPHEITLDKDSKIFFTKSIENYYLLSLNPRGIYLDIKNMVKLCINPELQDTRYIAIDTLTIGYETIEKMVIFAHAQGGFCSDIPTDASGIYYGYAYIKSNQLYYGFFNNLLHDYNDPKKASSLDNYLGFFASIKQEAIAQAFETKELTQPLSELTANNSLRKLHKTALLKTKTNIKEMKDRGQWSEIEQKINITAQIPDLVVYDNLEELAITARELVRAPR